MYFGKKIFFLPVNLLDIYCLQKKSLEDNYFVISGKQTQRGDNRAGPCNKLYTKSWQILVFFVLWQGTM